MTEKCLEHKTVLHLLPDRPPHAHKGDFGKILLLCGSCGYTGAAALAAMGLCNETARLPLTPMEEPFRGNMLTEMRKLGIEV